VSDDSVFDRLWHATPDEFVGERDELAKALRAEGRKAEADEVKAMRKPSLALWAVNHLAARRPEVIGDLVDLGRRAEGAVEQALRGDGAGAMRDLDRERRRAVGEATAAAEELAAAAGNTLTPAMAGRVHSTLDAATLRDETRTLLTQGRLPAELDAVGFSGLDDLDLGLAAAPDRGAQEAHERRRAEERVAAELRKAEAEADRLEAVAADAEATASVARARADDARRRADALRNT
jgi:hypothetical protein